MCIVYYSIFGYMNVVGCVCYRAIQNCLASKKFENL